MPAPHTPFRITGLSPEPFRPLYGMSDAALAERGAKRTVADACPGFPDRVELRDAAPGETLLLLNHEHQPAPTPYRSRHAIFVREGAEVPYDRVNEVPDVLRVRLIGLRAFDAKGMMIDAEVLEGAGAVEVIRRLLANPETAYLHAHFAKRGCYAARVERA